MTVPPVWFFSSPPQQGPHIGGSPGLNKGQVFSNLIQLQRFRPGLSYGYQSQGLKRKNTMTYALAQW